MNETTLPEILFGSALASFGLLVAWLKGSLTASWRDRVQVRRGNGLLYDMLSCPVCLSVWSSLVFVLSYALMPLGLGKLLVAWWGAVGACAVLTRLIIENKEEGTEEEERPQGPPVRLQEEEKKEKTSSSEEDIRETPTS